MSVLVTRSKTVSESVQDTVFCCLYMSGCGVSGLPERTIDLGEFFLEGFQEDIEGRFEFRFQIHRGLASGIGDVDLIEYCLVHQPFDCIAGVPVEGCTVIQQVEGFREVL